MTIIQKFIAITAIALILALICAPLVACSSSCDNEQLLWFDTIETEYSTTTIPITTC